MKKLLTVSLLFLFNALAFGQKSAFPQEIINHFTSTYPNAQVKDWDKESNGTYNVEFRNAGKKYEAYYAADNSWVRTERDISRREVPQAVWNTLSKSEYASWKVDDIEEHQTPQYKSLYEIEVERGESDVYLKFLPDGTLLK